MVLEKKAMSQISLPDCSLKLTSKAPGDQSEKGKHPSTTGQFSKVVAKEKILVNHTSEKVFVSRIYRELFQISKITQLKRAGAPVWLSW